MTEADEIRAKIKEYRTLVETCDDPIDREAYFEILNDLGDRLVDIELLSSGTF